jgi:DNA helicase HerA-like ATPase
VTSFGPTLLSKVLQLNQTQESSLGLVFHYADKAGLPLVDLKDLRAVIQHLVSDEGKKDLENLGGLAKQTAGVILRELVNFSAAGGEEFFGEPEFDVHDLLRTSDDGRGVITLLELPGVHDKPVLFSTFLLWLLAELFEVMPEVGDIDKPKLVFFFEEAHLLFTDASRDFLTALIQTARLIRSKGIGVFFVTQTPKDIHEDVLAQLGSRVQHQLRAFTPNDADALKASVRTYPTSTYDLEKVLQELGIGEAVVTVMSERGAPTPVAHAMLPAPQSKMAPSDAPRLDEIISGSPLAPKYTETVDRSSAYEMLMSEIEAASAEPGPADAPAPTGTTPAPTMPSQTTVPSDDPYAGMTPEQRLEAEILGTLSGPGAGRGKATRAKRSPTPSSRSAGESLIETFLKSAAQSLGKEISRGVFGNRRRR